MHNIAPTFRRMARKRAEERAAARGARMGAKADWVAFPLRMPPDMDATVRQIAASDVMAPSVNTVLVTLLAEALAARAARRSK